MHLTLSTKAPKQILDITGQCQEFISKSEANYGLLHIFVHHTTCAITTADLDPGTDQDFLDALDEMFPSGNYRHPHDPSHVGDHIMSSIIGPSLTIPFQNHQLQLGTWQQIVLVELSGPRERNISLSVLNATS